MWLTHDGGARAEGSERTRADRCKKSQNELLKIAPRRGAFEIPFALSLYLGLDGRDGLFNRRHLYSGRFCVIMIASCAEVFHGL
mgnify:CR=1 FL=1